MKVFFWCMAVLLAWSMGVCTGRLIEHPNPNPGRLDVLKFDGDRELRIRGGNPGMSVVVSPMVELGSNDYGPDYKNGWHYVSPAGQDIEVRGEHKYPLHLTDDGSVEIESGGNKTMVIVHPPSMPPAHIAAPPALRINSSTKKE